MFFLFLVIWKLFSSELKKKTKQYEDNEICGNMQEFRETVEWIYIHRPTDVVVDCAEAGEASFYKPLEQQTRLRFQLYVGQTEVLMWASLLWCKCFH